MAPPQVPFLAADSERVRAIKTGLNRYFAAVSLPLRLTDDNDSAVDESTTDDGRVGRAQKLAAIVDNFSAEAEIITGTAVLFGRDRVRDFYGGPNSPVMKDPDFTPAIADPATVCISADENTIAVELKLTETMTVGDWFTFDDEAKIKRVRIYF
jgi:hypothetical protein